VLLLVLGGGAIGTTALSQLGGGSIAGSLLGDFALFWVGSRLLTAEDVPWLQLAGGAAAAAVAWQILQLGGGVYVRHVLRIASNTYGTFAVVIGLLSFIYLATLVAVVVAEANVVAARRLWPRSLVADAAAFPQQVSRVADSAAAPARRQSSPSTERRTSMESIVERAGQMAGSQLKKMRWALGINGALSIAFGVVVLVWPSPSLFALTVVFGAFTAANGIVGLAAAISGTVRIDRGWFALSSLLSLVVGVLLLIWSGNGISELALLYVIGAYAVGFGVLAVIGAFWLPLDGGDRALLALSGLVSILFGVVMFARPGDGALVVLALIAAYALVVGISELVVAIGGKRLLESGARKFVAQAKPQTS
jgi:uncharacterized membrane protein HdeD (DUF308 family)